MKRLKKGALQDFIWSLPLIKNSIEWSQQHSMWGFGKVPIYDVVVFIIQELRRDNLVTRANSIAFSFFLSLFPTLLVFFTLIPFLLPLFQDFIIPLIADEIIVHNSLGEVDFNQTIIAQFNQLLAQVPLIPTSAHQQLIQFIESILLQPRFGLLSVGFVLAIFFSSNGMLSMMRGFSKMHQKTTFVKRNPLKKRLIAIELTFLLGLLVFAALLFIILGNTVINWLFGIIHAGGFINFTVQLLRVLTMFLLFYFGISFLYRRGISTRQKMPFFTPGTMLATILSLLTSWGFALYVNNYSRYNDLYGSIGTFIVIMLWIQINAFILLIGFELNASIAVNRDLKKSVKHEQSDSSPTLEEE